MSEAVGVILGVFIIAFLSGFAVGSFIMKNNDISDLWENEDDNNAN